MSSRPDFTEVPGIIPVTEFLAKLAATKLPVVRNHRQEAYYNVPAAFDIETSSFYEGPKEKDSKRAIMYHWQFGIMNMVTSGRDWNSLKEFLELLKIICDISNDRRLVIYVHNLPYEFQFMRKHIDWDKVFILDERKPVYAISSGLEFRCMMKLAGGRSLAAVSNDLQKYKVQKMVGDLDYSKIRTPSTPMTDTELKYCENDIRVCLAYIMEKIEQDGDITRIPLTNTGYVRQHCRRRCRKHWSRYRALMNALVISPNEYSQLKRGFQGGFTHANAHYVRAILSRVGSYDLTSAYPSVMLLEKFPISPSRMIDKTIESEEELKPYLSRYCCLFDIEIFMIEPKLHQDHPISSSKCFEMENEILDNGRIVFATRIKTTITEQDFYTYREFYSWERIVVTNLRIYEKGYLPKDFTEAILDLYSQKTKLKGIEGQELEYMISKNMLNAAYGMAVTDPVRMEFDYIYDEFVSSKQDVEEAIERYNADKKRFLFYPWGVWVTAYCRRNLFSAIKATGEDYVYADTDSVKILHPERHTAYFEDYNAGILSRIENAAEFRRQDPTVYSPVNRNGKECPIGLWDFEGIYDRFKTLGAKRYLVQVGDDYKLTVAGTNKKKSCDYLVSTGFPFEEFDDNLTIPASSTGKNLLTYIDTECEGVVIDYLGEPYPYHELSFIHMEGTEYHLSLADEFIRYLKGIKDGSE